jgi:hypothetical protein
VISQTGEHPEEDLVKFGYKLNVKVFLKLRIGFLFFKLAILWKAFVEIWRL